MGSRTRRTAAKSPGRTLDPAFPVAARAGAGRAALANAAYEHIRILLLEGSIDAGQRLSVVELAREAGCSRVPIMEAIKRLEADGLVEILPQVGCRVARPAAIDVRDFFRFFAAAESLVARLAAERRTDADLVEFRAACALIDRSARAAGPPARKDPTWRHLNLRFHSMIHRMARAPMPSRIAASLWDRADFYIRLAFGSLYFSRDVRAAHQSIRAAITDGDAAGAEAAMRGHLERVGEAVAANIAARG